jgi:recombination protein RecT
VSAVESREVALSPVQRFVLDVLPPSKKEELYASLPAHVTPARFERNLANAVMREPKLLNCDPRVVYREVCKIAALGLVLDPQLGEAYLIVDRKNDVQARIGYRGLIKLVRQSGDVATVYAHDICENDETAIELGTSKSIVHKPDFMKPRGNVGAFYAVVVFKDGVTDFDVMTINEVHAIRDRSDAWRAFKANFIKSTPWSTDEGEMSKKTVLRRLCKRLPMSPDLAEALRLEDEADRRDYRDPAPVRLSLAERFSTPAPPAAEGFSREHVDAETGEVTAITNSGAVPPDAPSEDAGAPDPRAPASDNPAPSMKDRLLSALGAIDSNVDLGRWWTNPKVVEAVEALSQADADELQAAYDAKAAELGADDDDDSMDGGK